MSQVRWPMSLEPSARTTRAGLRASGASAMTRAGVGDDDGDGDSAVDDVNVTVTTTSGSMARSAGVILCVCAFFSGVFLVSSTET